MLSYKLLQAGGGRRHGGDRWSRLATGCGIGVGMGVVEEGEENEGSGKLIVVLEST